MSVQPLSGPFCNPLRDNLAGMYRPYTCAEAALRPFQPVEMSAPPADACLPANVAQGVNVDVIVFCDGTPQMKCTAKLGSKAFTHAVSTWYLYSVPPMLRKALRKLQQCRWGYGFEVVKDPSNGEVKVVHLTYHTKPINSNKEEPATLRLTTYTNPDDGASAVVEYARDFKASRKRKLSLHSSSKAMPSGTRIRLSGGTVQYADHDFSSPIPSQSGSPTSPYFTRSPSISSDCTQASDRMTLPNLPIPNLAGSNSTMHMSEAGWHIKEEPLINSHQHENSSMLHTSSAMHTHSATDGSRGPGSATGSAQPTPSSLAQYDDGYASQASSHTTPTPSPLTASNQQPVQQVQGARNDVNRYMPPPQRSQGPLGGGHHRLFGGVHEYLSSNSSNTVLPKSMDTTASPGSGECSDDDIDPGMFCNNSFSNSSFSNNLGMPGSHNAAVGNNAQMGMGPMHSNMLGPNNSSAPLGGARKLCAGSTVFNFKPQTSKSYDPDATVHSMYLPKDPAVMPSCASRLPNLRPVHIPSSMPLGYGQNSLLDDWHSQAAASATPTPNSGMAAPAQLPNLFDVSSAAPEAFDNITSFARSQCAAGHLPSLADLLDIGARLPTPSPGPMAGALSAAGQLAIWGDDSFGNDCGARNDNYQGNMDLDTLLNTSNWGQN